MRTIGVLFLLTLLLAGCGGSGGGDSEPSAHGETDALSRALASGNSDGLEDVALLDAALAEIERLEKKQQALVQGFGDGALNYPVPQSSHFVHASYGNGFTILRGSKDGRSLASVASLDGRRAAGAGFVFFAPRDEAVGMTAFGKELLTWLAGGELPSGVATAGIKSADLTTWMNASLPQAALNACPEGLPDACLQDSQVLIVSDRPASGDEAALKSLVAQAGQRGIGVLYIHTRGWSDTTLGKDMLAQVGLSLGGYGGNYWAKDTLTWGSAAQMLQDMQSGNPLKTALKHFRHSDFPVNFAECESGPANGDCDNYEPLQKSLLKGLDELRAQLSMLDSQGRTLFNEPGYRLLKLLVLLGDLWRQEITYPMKKETASQDAFMRALFADYSVHYLRHAQPAQTDLGSFSEPMLTQPAITTLTRERRVTGNHFTALGAYVLPGQKVSITRLDSSDVDTAIRINTQRTGSTRLWSEYSRPRFLSSPSMRLEAGDILHFTSPYGGTLQLVHRNASDLEAVTLRMESVVRQPFLQYGPEMDLAAFASDLQQSNLTWTEIRTPFAEVHSRRDRMNQSINESRYAGNSQAFLDDLFEYVLRDAYTLAGFQGGEITLPDRVVQRCQTLGWDCSSQSIHGLPNVQHINVDWFAHCGSGCSGNPYDQSWALDPYGWGESHELGHNLQRNLLNIHGGRSGEVSNNVFPLHKNWRLLKERGVDRSNDRLDYHGAFTILKNATGSSDPYQVAYEGIWEDDSYAANNGLRMAFYAQLPHLWRDVVGDNEQGWDIITLLYLAERQFINLDSDQWLARRGDFGMGSFANRPELTGNDFMLIVTSHLAGRDLRPIWDQWGVNYSAEASAQLDALSLPLQESVIWVGPSSNDWDSIQKIPVTDSMAWPF